LTMGDSRAAAGMDRLPWLADEPKKAPSRRRRVDLAAWGAAALLILAGTSFWIGSLTKPARTGELVRTQPPRATIAVPEARPAGQEVRIAPQPQVIPLPVPEVRPVAAREVHLASPPRKATAGESEKTSVSEATGAAQSAPEIESKSQPEVAPAPHEVLQPWPPRVIAGAAGRLAQVGAFGSRLQAKRGWWAMARAYPAMEHLPAVVVETRNSHGRSFYRFQVGTTSQAHSEVLCQRMEKIHLSCAVVGLPWKAKVER